MTLATKPPVINKARRAVPRPLVSVAPSTKAEALRTRRGNRNRSIPVRAGSTVMLGHPNRVLDEMNVRRVAYAVATLIVIAAAILSVHFGYYLQSPW
jgi:hypothetical protein